MKQIPIHRKAWMSRGTKPLTRKSFWQSRSGQLRRKTAMKKKNVERIAKKRKLYATHLRSEYWLQLRYERFLFDQGMCQCEWCLAVREERVMGGMVPADLPEGIYAGEAFVPIPVHFTARGSAPWRRIRGFSTHHVRYRTLGEERLQDIRTMYVHHHEATEAKYSTRRRYLGNS